MKINGYQLREALKRLTLQRDVLQSQFKESLHTFEISSTPPSPIKLMDSLEKTEFQIALLEEAQQKFNQIVRVNVQNETFSLVRAVKLVGGAARREKLWKDIILPQNVSRYSFPEPLSRNKDTVYAVPTISKEEALIQSKDATLFASALRNAIAKGNNAEVDIESIGLNEEHFTSLFQ